MKRMANVLLLVVVLGAAVAVAQRRPPPPQRRGRQQNLKNRVEIVIHDDYRHIRSNGIPDHQAGRFPNRRNPNAIAEQDHRFRVPVAPNAADTVTRLGLSPFGVAVNGVPFDPGAAEFWRGDRNSGWQYEALSGKIDLGLDKNNAHVQPGGAYHYHGSPKGLIAKLGQDRAMVLIGYAADGFPIYDSRGYSEAEDPNSEVKRLRSSYRVKKGRRPSGPRGRYDGTFVEDYEFVADAGDLNECNGRTGVTPEYPEGTYYYVVTDEFPFIPRCFRGTPDESFRRRGRPPGRGPRGRRGP